MLRNTAHSHHLLRRTSAPSAPPPRQRPWWPFAARRATERHRNRHLCILVWLRRCRRAAGSAAAFPPATDKSCREPTSASSDSKARIIILSSPQLRAVSRLRCRQDHRMPQTGDAATLLAPAPLLAPRHRHRPGRPSRSLSSPVNER